MRKRKRNVMNVTVVNNEIDYDKLAEAVAKAQKQGETLSPSSEWMKYMLVPIFWGIAIFSGLLSIGMFVTLFQNAADSFSNGILMGVITLVVQFLLACFTAFFALFAFFSAKEVDKEKDRAYVASLFSNVVSVVAFIVALVALLKGVG